MSNAAPPQAANMHPLSPPVSQKKKPTERAGTIALNYEPTKSRGYELLKQIMREPITIQALLSLAFVLSNYLGVKISRDYMRRKELVIKWFDETVDLWEPLLPFIRLEYVLSGSTEQDSSDSP